MQSTATKIGNVPNFVSSAAVLLDTVITEAKLGEELTNDLRKAIDLRIQSSCAPIGSGCKVASGAPPRDQCMKFMCNYLTQADYRIIDNASSTEESREMTLAKRLADFGYPSCQ